MLPFSVTCGITGGITGNSVVIGANTAIFSVIHAVKLSADRSKPFPGNTLQRWNYGGCAHVSQVSLAMKSAYLTVKSEYLMRFLREISI